MRNEPNLETQRYPKQPPTVSGMLALLLDSVRARLPVTWRISLNTVAELPSSGSAVDARLTLAANDGSLGVIDVEVKKSTGLGPADIAALAQSELRASDARRDILLLAPYLSPRARALLAESGLNYADATGNLLLRLDYPALYIEALGAQENPWYEPRSLRSLKGPTAGRAVRALCDFRPPFGIRALAEKARTPASVISRVARLLEQEALLERNDRGVVLAVSVTQVIERWTRDYSLIRSNRVETCLEPRGLDAFIEKLRGASERYAVSGSLAAAQLAPYAPPRLAAVYVRDLMQARGELRLRQVERGANILLLEPFNDVVFDRTIRRMGIEYAAPTQVAADLLTGPGRSPEEGYELLRWMEGHRDDWQRP